MIIIIAQATSSFAQDEKPLTSFQGHAAAVNAAVYTTNGRYIVTAGADQLVKIWDAKTGEEIRALAGHTGQVLSVAISPDDAMIVSAAGDNTLRMWDVPRPEPLRTFAGVASPVRDVAVSPNGQWAATVGDDKAARVWRMEDGKSTLLLEGHTAETIAAAFRADNNQLATADAAGEIRLWNPLDGQLQATLGAHVGEVRGMMFHPNNQQLITAGEDGQLKVWQLPPAAPRTFAGHTTPVRSVALNSDGQQALVGSDDSVRVFTTANGAAVRELAGPIGPTFTVAVAPNNSVAAAAGEAGAIKFWNFGDGADRLSILGHDGPIRSIAFHPDNVRLASAGDDGTIRLWRLPTPPAALAGHTADVVDVAVSPNGQLAVTVSSDKTVRAWNPTNGQAAWQQPAGEQPLTAVAFRSDSAQLATGDAAGNVQLRTASNGAAEAALGSHFGSIEGIAFHPAGESLATIGGDNCLKIWKLPMPPAASLAASAEAVNAVALTQDGKFIITAGADKTLRVFDATSGAQARQFAEVPDVLTSLALSNDDKLTVAGHAGGVIKLWNTPDGTPWKGPPPAAGAQPDPKVLTAPAELLGHDGAVVDVAFDTAAQRIASAGADGTVRLWNLPAAPRVIASLGGPAGDFAISPDGKTAAFTGVQQERPAIFLCDLASGKIVQTLLGHEAAVTCVAFNADGKLLASGGADNTARVWNLADPKFAEVAKVAHATPVTAVAISTDGKQLYSAAGDFAIRTSSIADGSEVRVTPGHSGIVVSLRVVATTLFSASADGTVRLWKTADGAAIRSIAHGGAVASLAISDDGKTIASAGADNAVKLWNAADGAAIATLAGHTAAPADLHFNADATRLVSIAADGLWLWDVVGKRRLESFALPEGEQRGVGFHAGELVAAAADGSLRMITPHLLAIIDAHEGGVHCIALTADGQWVATCGADKTLKLWSVADGKPLATFAGPTDAVQSIVITPDGKHLLAGGVDKHLYVWPLPAAAAAEPVAALSRWELPAAIRSLDLDIAGQRVAIGGEDNIVRVWDWTIGRELERFAGHTAPVLDVALAADGAMVISGSADKTARRAALSLSHIAVLGATPRDLAYLPDASKLIIAGDEPQLTQWQIGETGLAKAAALPAAEAKPEGFVAAPQMALAVRPDGAQVASLDAAGRANVFSASDGTLAYVVEPLKIDPPADLPAAPADAEPVKPAGGIAFSADNGKLLVGEKTDVRVFDATTGQILQRFEQPASVQDVAFAPDNLTLLVGRTGAETGAALQQFSLERIIAAHEGPATSIAFSPDGAVLLCGGDDKQVRTWTVADGAPRLSYAGSMDAITTVAFTKDGQNVLAGGVDKTVRLWPLNAPAEDPAKPEAAAVEAKASFAFPDVVRSISTSADNTRLAAVGDDGVVRVRDMQTGVELERFTASDGPALAVAFAPDSRTLVSGGADNAARAWTMSLVRSITADTEQLHDLALINAGAQAITAGSEGVKQWNLADGNMLRALNPEPGAFVSVAVRGDNQQVIAGDADSKLHFWSAAGELAAKVTLPAVANRVRYSADNLKIVAKCADDHLRFFNPADATPTYELTSDKPLTGATFAADNRTVLTGGPEFRQWLYASPTAVRTLSGHGGSVFSATFSRDGRWIASTSADQTVRIWDAATGTQSKQLSGHEGGVFSASFSPDGALLVSCGADKSVRLWDTLGGRQLKQMPVGDDSLYSVAFFPDGKRVAVAGLDRKIYFVDALTGKIDNTLEDHPDYLYRLTFNRAGTRMMSCGYGGNIFIWNAANGQQLASESLRQVTNFADYSPDGERIVVSGGDGRAYFLDVPAKAK